MDGNWLVALLELVYGLVAIVVDVTACPMKPADFIFLLDGSGSEGSQNFNKQLQFIATFIEQFEIGPNNNRVSVVTFATEVHNEFYLNRYADKDEVIQHITNIKYPDGETNTHEALQFVISNTLAPSADGRKAYKIVVVLTDGRSIDPEKTKLAALKLKSLPMVEVLTIGIGNHVDPVELLAIASDPDHVFRVTDFDALHTIQSELTGTACKVSMASEVKTRDIQTTTENEGHTTTGHQPSKTKPDPLSPNTIPVTKSKMTSVITSSTVQQSKTKTDTTEKEAACGETTADIVFILDSSDSEGEDNFHREVEFVYTFADQFIIGKQNVQFSVVTFSSDVRNDFYFNTYGNRDDVLHAIRNIRYIGQGTHTALAIAHVRNNNLSLKFGARAGSSKYVFIITDGRSDYPDETRHEAKLLQEYAEVIAIGVGPKVDDEELTALASNHQVQVDSFDVLHTIHDYLNNLACKI